MLDTLLNLYNIAENKGITIDTINLKKKGVSIKLNNKCYIGLSNKLNGDFETRDVLAEELGHCCTNSFYTLNTPLPLLKQNVDKAERQAKDWAIRNILPLPQLLKSIKSHCGDLYLVAEDFDTGIDYIKDAIEYYTRKNVMPSYNEIFAD